MLQLAGLPDADARVGRRPDHGAGDPAGRAGTGTSSASRDAVKTYNLVDRAGLQALSPGIDWDAWLDGLGAPAGAFDEVVVRQPDFVTALRRRRSPTSTLDDWKLWLAWQVVHAARAAT